jgi:hypothetical protein
MDITKLLLASMRSLWGNLTPNVRKVSVSYKENDISLHFYYNENPSEIEIELSEIAGTELIANFFGEETICCERHVINYPEHIEVHGSLVYSRYEE